MKDDLIANTMSDFIMHLKYAWYFICYKTKKERTEINMMYSKPQMRIFSADEIREFQAKAGSASCKDNSGTTCGTNVCICVTFACLGKK